MIRAMVTGTLHSDPQARTSQNGKAFTTGKLKADATDGGMVWASIIAFGETAERLATLKAGQTVAITGRTKLSAWMDAKTDEPKAGLDIVVDELATLRARPKPKAEPAQVGFDDELTL